MAVIGVRSATETGGPAVKLAEPEPLVVTVELKMKVSPCVPGEVLLKNSSVYWVFGSMPTSWPVM